jgi:phosphoheptose isomerase
MVCAVLATTRERGALTAALTGKGGGAIAMVTEIVLAVPSTDTARFRRGISSVVTCLAAGLNLP